MVECVDHGHGRAAFSSPGVESTVADYRMRFVRGVQRRDFLFG